MNYNVIAAPRLDKKDSKGLAPLYIFIYEGSKLVNKQSIGQKVNPASWIPSTRQVEKKYPNATLINSVINKKIADVKVQLLNAEVAGIHKNIYDVLHKEKAKDVCFFEFAENQITQKNYADETRRSYRIFLGKIKTFKSSLKISQVDFKFLQGYEAHLRDELKNDVNTIWGNFKFINTILNDAIKSKYLIEHPFKTYTRPKYKQTARTYLTFNELSRIEDFISTNEDKELNQVGKYFLFMAYTGLRFSDAIRVNTLHIINDERIVIETQKTKQVANLFINAKVRTLLTFVIDNPLTMSQVDFNRKLKIIAAFAGIRKRVSSHTGRHSFGAQLVALGVPEKHAQGLLAHGSARSTKVYYHLDNASLDDAMKKFNS